MPSEIIALIHLADCYAWKYVEGIEDVSADEAVLQQLSVTAEQIEEYVTTIQSGSSC